MGAGTFLPVKADDTADHAMHAEWGTIDAATAERLNAVCLEIVNDESVKKRLAEIGLVTTGSTPAAFLDRVKAETERWTRVVKENDIKIEG